MNEVAGRMRKRADLFEPGSSGPADEFVHDPATEATTSSLSADHHRPHFRDGVADRRHLPARKYLIVLNGDDESMHMNKHFPELTRQEMALGKMLVDQFVDRIGVLCTCSTDRDRRVRETARASRDSRFSSLDQRQQHQACTSASTAANTSSRISTARSRSSASIVSGGSMRTTFSLVRLTSRPCSRALSTIGVASMASC